MQDIRHSVCHSLRLLFSGIFAQGSRQRAQHCDRSSQPNPNDHWMKYLGCIGRFQANRHRFDDPLHQVKCRQRQHSLDHYQKNIHQSPAWSNFPDQPCRAQQAQENLAGLLRGHGDIHRSAQSCPRMALARAWASAQKYGVSPSIARLSRWACAGQCMHKFVIGQRWQDSR